MSKNVDQRGLKGRAIRKHRREVQRLKDEIRILKKFEKVLDILNFEQLPHTDINVLLFMEVTEAQLELFEFRKRFEQ